MDLCRNYAEEVGCPVSPFQSRFSRCEILFFIFKMRKMCEFKSGSETNGSAFLSFDIDAGKFLVLATRQKWHLAHSFF